MASSIHSGRRVVIGVVRSGPPLPRMYFSYTECPVLGKPYTWTGVVSRRAAYRRREKDRY